jgi:hypothetical protein
MAEHYLSARQRAWVAYAARLTALADDYNSK